MFRGDVGIKYFTPLTDHYKASHNTFFIAKDYKV
jgi:hypothetical protein